MAPEQILGLDPSPATDVYALGVLAFEMLTAQRPFRGAGAKVMQQHLRARRPRVSAAAPSLPVLLDGVIAKAMARRRRDRYASAWAFAAALRAAWEAAEGATTRISSAALHAMREGLETPPSGPVVEEATPRPWPWRWIALLVASHALAFALGALM